MSTYPTDHHQQLISAITALKSEKEVQAFLRDILTPAEIDEFSRRWQIAVLLWTTDKPYLEIAAKVDTSTTTVTRVAHWLFKENQHGYQTALKRLYPAGPVRTV